MSGSERIFAFQALDEVTIREILGKSMPNVIVRSILPLKGGMSTSNYVIQTGSGTDKYVLRIYPLDNDNSCREEAAYTYARSKIPVPEIYACDRSKKIIPNAFMIMEYIDGPTLGEFITAHGEFPGEIVRSISSSLALLHHTEYTYMALFDGELRCTKRLESLEEQFRLLLDGPSGMHISHNTKEKITCLLERRGDMLEQIGMKYVFSHGDFIFSNIIITPSLQAYFLDFEYCLSAPVFYDIGKFFRTRKNTEKYIGPKTIAAFSEGYNSKAAEPLPRNWYALSKLNDIATLLHLINKPSIPAGWGEEVDAEIACTLKLLCAY